MWRPCIVCLMLTLLCRHVWSHEAAHCDVLRTAASQSKEAWAIIHRPLKVYLGSSNLQTPGFLSLPQKALDVTAANDYKRWFCLESVDTFLTEHTFEHIPLTDHYQAFGLMFKYLKPGGLVRTAVPLYRDRHRVTSVDIKYGHVTFHTRGTLVRLLEEIGFTNVTALEFYDENNNVCTRPYDSCDGRIRRSFRHDERNLDFLNESWSKLKKTTHNELGDNCRPGHFKGAASLVVDAHKPL